jgi:hypothetical protein
MLREPSKNRYSKLNPIRNETPKAQANNIPINGDVLVEVGRKQAYSSVIQASRQGSARLVHDGSLHRLPNLLIAEKNKLVLAGSRCNQKGRQKDNELEHAYERAAVKNNCVAQLAKTAAGQPQ